MTHIIRKVLELTADQKKEARLILPGQLDELLAEMRAAVPVPGSDWVKALTVVVAPGMAINPHVHAEWTALFYADQADTPLVVCDCIERQAEPGAIEVLPPLTRHAVPRNLSGRRRVSVAMLVLDSTG